MGFPGDEDPKDSEPEVYCPDCNDLLELGKGWMKCESCGFYDEADPDEKFERIP